MRYRIEKDALGKQQIPAEAYYGIGTFRSKELFQITKHGLCRQMIKALSVIKKAAAKANLDLDLLPENVAEVIALSCDEIINGRLHGQFVTDVIQGGSGASMNTNANEVIANRANEMLGGEKGKYDFVHPTDHVNLGQNTGDVILLTGKITTIRLTKKLLAEAKKLYSAYHDKIGESGLTRQTGLTLGEELTSFANALERDMKRVETALNGLHEIRFSAAYENQEQGKKFVEKFIKYLSTYSGENFHLTKNIFDNGRNLDAISWISSALKIMSSDLAKVAADLALIARNGKIVIPQAIAETSAPVVIEMVRQVSYYIMGNDLTISRSVEGGELDGNIFYPIIFACMFESINLIRRTCRTFREKVIEVLEVNV
ncbi:MAG TPA: aspartate ammonia-lyase [Acholeplasmataceae bacterium]|jgi:aspartate ammonia-lyase|nr:aspartate ammonia-lyase [Acholeplasmataceae bacterium]